MKDAAILVLIALLGTLAVVIPIGLIIYHNPFGVFLLVWGLL